MNTKTSLVFKKISSSIRNNSIPKRAFASMPKFLGEYNKLLEKSKIMERLLPRKFDTANQLQETYPFVLSTINEFNLADLDAINKVIAIILITNILIGTFRTDIRFVGPRWQTMETVFRTAFCGMFRERRYKDGG